jgi:hypothetical protein
MVFYFYNWIADKLFNGFYLIYNYLTNFERKVESQIKASYIFNIINFRCFPAI